MKKLLLLFTALIGFSLMARGQSASYMPFQVNFTVGFDEPLYGKGTSSDWVFAMEPQIHLGDKFSFGFRIEKADLTFNIDPSKTFLGGNVYQVHGYVASYCATGEYYF